MDAIINHGTWATFTTLVDEPNLLVRSLKRKFARDKTFKKGAATKSDERGRYTNPTATFTMDVDVQAQSGLGSLGVGQAVAGGLANFDAIWREHDPADGKLILDDVEDSADISEDEPLTSSLTIIHKPFIDA